jgi:hypothetical protein
MTATDSQFFSISQAPRGNAQEAGSEEDEPLPKLRPRLATSDTTSVASDATTLSDLLNDAPWVRSGFEAASPYDAEPVSEPEPEVEVLPPMTREQWNSFKLYHSTR